jgi:hypothetical protein
MIGRTYLERGRHAPRTVRTTSACSRMVWAPEGGLDLEVSFP